jgi:phosphate uptake regulator
VSDRAPERPLAAFAELQALVRHLGEELAAFRGRALSAESRLRAVAERLGDEGIESAERVGELERENEELRRRLAIAGEQARQMFERLRFLRQQQDGSEG